jgi:hypothetical protein
VAILLPPQIGAYAYQAGVKDQRALATAIAIAIAESAGNTNAHNSTPPDDSYGLWQINMLGSLGPSRRSALGISDNKALFQPATNARAMFMISGGGKNWRPWTTYNGLRYRAVYPAAYAAAGAVRAAGGVVDGVEGIGEAAGGVADAVGGMAEAAAAALDYAGAVRAWLAERHNWTRLLWWMAGVTLVTGGLLMATRDTPVVRTAVKAGKEAVGVVATRGASVATKATKVKGA